MTIPPAGARGHRDRSPGRPHRHATLAGAARGSLPLDGPARGRPGGRQWWLPPCRRAVLRPLAALLAALCLMVAGCSNSDSKAKEQKVQTVAEADTSREVDAYAHGIAAAAKGELKNYETIPSACEGRRGEFSKDVYTVMGGGQILLPQEQHVPLLTELRNQWTSQGFTVENDTTTSPGERPWLAVRAPDQFRIRVSSVVEGTALALMINSPCRRSPTPRS